MSEGELKKRIRERNKVFPIVCDPPALVELEKILDEASKEFPCGKCPRFGKDDDNCLNYCCGRYDQFFKWFKKWYSGTDEMAMEAKK